MQSLKKSLSVTVCYALLLRVNNKAPAGTIGGRGHTGYGELNIPEGNDFVAIGVVS